MPPPLPPPPPDPFPPTGPDGLPDRGAVDVRLYLLVYEMTSPLGSSEPARGGLTFTAPSRGTVADIFEAGRQALAQVNASARMVRIAYRTDGDDTVTVWSREESEGPR